VDVDCGWAGDATVIAAATDGRSAPADHEFHTHRGLRPTSGTTGRPDPDGRNGMARIDGYELVLVGLGPSRKSDEKLDRGDYRARFSIRPAA
jgi:hypothetical protein